MHAMKQDEKLSTALAHRNRNELLQYATPIFNNIRRDFQITHLYFTGIDRVNLLRVHAPLRYGDTISGRP